MACLQEDSSGSNDDEVEDEYRLQEFRCSVEDDGLDGPMIIDVDGIDGEVNLRRPDRSTG